MKTIKCVKVSKSTAVSMCYHLPMKLWEGNVCLSLCAQEVPIWPLPVLLLLSPKSHDTPSCLSHMDRDSLAQPLHHIQWSSSLLARQVPPYHPHLPWLTPSTRHFQTCSLFSPLLDKVMSRNQWHIGVHQHHLMFKGHWRAPHETIYGHKKKVCLDKIFPLGHFKLHFIMFLIRQMTTKASNAYICWKLGDGHPTEIPSCLNTSNEITQMITDYHLQWTQACVCSQLGGYSSSWWVLIHPSGWVLTLPPQTGYKDLVYYGILEYFLVLNNKVMNYIVL